MKKVILYEHGSSMNHGCEAIVRSTCEVLGLNKKNAVLYTNDITSDKQYGLNQIINIENSHQFGLSQNIQRVVRKASGGRIFQNIEGSQAYLNKKHNLAISIGGDNYCYKGLIPDLVDRHRALKEAGNKVVLWGASFKEQLFSKEVIEDLKSYDLITVRESLSAQYLADAGINNYLMTFDSAFVLKPTEIQWPDNNDHKNVVGINLSPLIFCYADKQHIMSAYIKLIEYILKNTDLDVALIPHVTMTGSDDREVLLEIKTHFIDCERVFAITGDYNCCQLKSLISKCRFFIGARTHATIAAYSTMVPTCVLGYSSKSIGIAQDLFGTHEKYVIDSIAMEDERELVDAFEFLVKNEQEIKGTLIKMVPQKVKLLSSVSQEVGKLML